jgi:imidazole glycerol phosphate synthase glutamine amidotransferase subunit
VIAIFDYGAGNLRSVQNTLAEVGAPYVLVDDGEGLRSATKIILPGVGHFGQMLRSLDAMRVRDVILERIDAGVPLLGICLGLQALFAASEEAPELKGLGVFPETVRRFSGDVRVPQMGWNLLDVKGDSRLLKNLGEKPYVYFANSYHAPLCAATSATANYTIDFTAAIERGNLYGVQFHPEKSGPLGLRIMKNFVELT